MQRESPTVESLILRADMANLPFLTDNLRFKKCFYKILKNVNKIFQIIDRDYYYRRKPKYDLYKYYV